VLGELTMSTEATRRENLGNIFVWERGLERQKGQVRVKFEREPTTLLYVF
jgi:ribosomal protein L31E